jgi:hypothetical protein
MPGTEIVQFLRIAMPGTAALATPFDLQVSQIEGEQYAK